MSELDPDDPRVKRSRAAALAAARGLMLREGIDAVTHLRVAAAAGLGRKTIYRHWPTRDALLRDTLSTADLPHARPTGELRRDLLEHLELLRRALVEGPLCFVLAVLIERSTLDSTFRALRDSLTEEGCRPLKEMLGAAIARGDLPADLDVDRARAALEGPLFYRAMLLDSVEPAEVVEIVDGFLRMHAARGG